MSPGVPFSQHPEPWASSQGTGLFTALSLVTFAFEALPEKEEMKMNAPRTQQSRVKLTQWRLQGNSLPFPYCPWTLTDCFKKLKDIENHNLGSWGARRGVCYEIYLVSVLYLAREAMDSQIFRKKNVLHLVNVHHNSNNNALLECRVRKTRMQAEKKH